MRCVSHRSQLRNEKVAYESVLVKSLGGNDEKQRGL